MVLVRLYKVEVGTKAFLEPVVTVKLELGTDNGVTAGVTRSKTSVVSTSTSTRISGKVGRSIIGRECTRTKARGEVLTSVEESFNFTGGTVNIPVEESGGNIREGLGHMTGLNIGVENLLATGNTVTPVGPHAVDIIVISIVGPLVDVGGNNGVTLNNPDKFFDRVVKIEFNLDIGVNSGFITSELELFNEIFVRTLSESATFVSIKVDVINEQSCGLQRRNAEELITVASSKRNATRTISKITRAGNIAILFGTKFEVNTNFVVLQSN